MAEFSKIEWTDHTFNPWRGCTKVHEGCAHCYAERDAKRFPDKLGVWGPHGTRVLASEEMWSKPVKWNAKAEKAGVRARVFCASIADVFEDWDGELLLTGSDLRMACPTCGFFGPRPIIKRQFGPPVDECPVCKGKLRSPHMSDARRALFTLINATPHLDWLLLTKRPENIRRMWADIPGSRRDNVWLGTSISLQEHADKQIPELLNCRDLATVLFLSIEPLLGSIDLEMIRDPNRFPGCAYFDVLRGRMIHEDDGNRWTPEPHLDWVIAGGESGPHARPMHPQWARDIRDQCQAAGVPFFFKQWGEWSPYEIVPGGDLGGLMRRGLVEQVRPFGEIDGNFRRGDVYMERLGKKRAGRLLDGVECSEFPEPLCRRGATAGGG